MTNRVIHSAASSSECGTAPEHHSAAQCRTSAALKQHAALPKTSLTSTNGLTVPQVPHFEKSPAHEDQNDNALTCTDNKSKHPGKRYDNKDAQTAALAALTPNLSTGGNR